MDLRDTVDSVSPGVPEENSEARVDMADPHSTEVLVLQVPGVVVPGLWVAMVPGGATSGVPAMSRADLRVTVLLVMDPPGMVLQVMAQGSPRVHQDMDKEVCRMTVDSGIKPKMKYHPGLETKKLKDVVSVIAV
jgi:hypothetical protein